VITSRTRPSGIALALAIFTTLLVACGHSPSPRFYSLDATLAGSGETPLDIALAIGPAQFPRELARKEIVTPAGGSRVEVNQFRLWSAPLEYEFLRVLGDDIARDIQSDRIAVYPGEPAFSIDYRIRFEVLQFDGVPEDSVTLRVRWVIAPPGSEAVAVGTFEHTQPVVQDANGDPYNALVAAHSAAIGALARDISAQLRELD
jgi:uncharacterized lipoprotein YmbA